MNQHIDTIHLLIVHRSENAAEEISNLLRNAGFAIRLTFIRDLDQFKHDLNEHPWDLLIVEEEHPVAPAAPILELVNHDRFEFPIVVLTEHYSSKIVTKWLEAGADGVVDSDNYGHLLLTITRLMLHLGIKREHDLLKQELNEAEKRCELLLQSSEEAIAYIHEGMHIYTNNAYIKLFDLNSTEHALATPILDLIDPTHHNAFKEYLIQHAKEKKPAEEFSFSAKRPNGDNFNAHLYLSPATYHDEHCIQVIVRVNNSDVERNSELNKLKSQDLLTGLYNRQYFMDEMEKYLITHEDHSTLLYIVLNDFHLIKDDVGLTGSDRVIGEMADILKSAIKPPMRLAHYSDDTFLLFMPHIPEENAISLVKQIISKINDGITETTEKSVNMRCTVGISESTEHTQEAQTLLTEAYTACHQALHTGAPFQVYESQHKEISPAEQGVIHEIKLALDAGKFKLLYQPLINLHGQTNEIYEVYLRMLSDEGNEISPNQFFPAASDAGLLSKIDRWVILQSIKNVSEKRLQGSMVNLYVLLTGSSIQDPELVPWINVALGSAKLSAEALTFEISIDDVMQHLDYARKFTKAIHELHCKVALSHFTGSEEQLEALSHVHADTIKLAGRLTEEISQEGDTAANIAKLKKLISSLQQDGKEVIVSKVEKAIVLPTLWNSGANYIQGYFLAEPSTHMNYDFAGAMI